MEPIRAPESPRTVCYTGLFAACRLTTLDVRVAQFPKLDACRNPKTPFLDRRDGLHLSRFLRPNAYAHAKCGGHSDECPLRFREYDSQVVEGLETGLSRRGLRCLRAHLPRRALRRIQGATATDAGLSRVACAVCPALLRI